MNPSELQARTYLFLEYLRHECGISYSKMARKAGLAIPPVAKHELSNKSCYRLCMAFREYVDGFDEYYGWRKSA
ncbi:winged helix-turn-helix domain-containing protein [Nitratifractor salsuginis]|uniref:XRE family transcriptional regulator n=1 Tax=Nitratifractor salsuginis (strain DSM 16511 / JCM 12458 / E9I37-1) TaxID=749222 RepID=E6WY57_NITSE|nr:winged helix-turn-helix domain-containing protein [Nitratifractor salsuginis]ADV46431.1 hypothetical protein Nitsa_1178 [Nitratifractor salsuginis DSM 16511]